VFVFQSDIRGNISGTLEVSSRNLRVWQDTVRVSLIFSIVRVHPPRKYFRVTFIARIRRWSTLRGCNIAVSNDHSLSPDMTIFSFIPRVSDINTLDASGHSQSSNKYHVWSNHNGVAIAMGCGLKVQVSNPGRGKIFFLFTVPDQFFGPPSLLSNGY
jgi:hypothetical protein